MGFSIQTLSAIFYTNDGIIASLESVRLKGEFDAHTGLFDKVGLRTNARKSASILPAMSHPTRMVNQGLHSASDGAGTLI